MKQQHHYRLRRFALIISALWLFTSACGQTAVHQTDALPTATTYSEDVLVVQTTTPIATLTASPEPVVAPTDRLDDNTSVDALASQTPEGYYQIGNPDAPITMVDYSDFF